MVTVDYAIRDASPSEDLDIAILFYNSFIDSAWNHNWFESRETPQAPIVSRNVASLNKADTARLLFYQAIVAAERLTKQPIRVLTSSESSEILGCAMWMNPGVRIPESPLALFRTGFLRLLFAWGLRGYRRINDVFENEVKRLQEEGFKARNATVGGALRPISGAYLQMIGVATKLQGHGLGSKLVQDGLEMYKDVPVILEATEVGPKAVYTKAGFELVGEAWAAKGECDDLGFCGKGRTMNTNGKPIFVMVKWN